MQRTEPTSEPRAERQFLTPLRAFAVAGVLLALFLALWLTGQRTDPSDPASTATTLSGTPKSRPPEEVLAEWRSLRLASFQAIKAKDATLISEVFTPRSPVRQIAEK